MAARLQRSCSAPHQGSQKCSDRPCGKRGEHETTRKSVCSVRLQNRNAAVGPLRRKHSQVDPAELFTARGGRCSAAKGNAGSRFEANKQSVSDGVSHSGSKSDAMSESSEGAASDPHLSPAPSGVYRMRSVTSGPLLALSTRRSLLQCRPHTIQHDLDNVLAQPHARHTTAPLHVRRPFGPSLGTPHRRTHARESLRCVCASGFRCVCARVAAVRALEHLYVVVLDERRAQDELEPRIAQHTRHDMR